MLTLRLSQGIGAGIQSKVIDGTLSMQMSDAQPLAERYESRIKRCLCTEVPLWPELVPNEVEGAERWILRPIGSE
jgi:hypothetical protein